MNVLKSSVDLAARLAAVSRRPNFRTVDLIGPNTYADIPAILKSLLLPQGAKRADNVAAFENEFAQIHEGGYAHSFSAGRVAFDAILDALEINAGDEVILPAFTCVAVPNPIIFRGAVPVYADISPASCNIDPKDVEKKISPRTKAIVAQHTFGLPAEMNRILEIAKDRRLKVVEDCAHALGARYKGHLVGTLGDASFFSMEQTKVISTGKGGVAYTRDRALSEKIRTFQKQCASPDRVEQRRMLAWVLHLIALRGPISALAGDVVNYYLERLRLIGGPVTTPEELHCLCPKDFRKSFPDSYARLGLAQLKRLRQNVDRRNAVARVYDRYVPELNVQVVTPPPDVERVSLRYPIWVDDKWGCVRYMRERGIALGVWFTSTVHPKGVRYEEAQYIVGSCPNAEAAVQHVVNLPTHPRLSARDAMRVVDALRDYQRTRQCLLSGGFHSIR